MAIDTATFEATLDSKIDAATTSNDAKEFLLLAKAVEATNNAVSSSSLAVSNNLSDVANAATALSNLGGVGAASPAFTGTPTAPTATAGTNTTQIATTAFVAGEVAGIVDAAPATLNTLNELAAALGDDANFSTTVTNSIATKLPLAGGTLTGALTTTDVTVNGTLNIEEVVEKVLTSTSTSGTLNMELVGDDGAIFFATSNQTANRTINFRGDGSTTLNNSMAVGESFTSTVLMTQGSTAYYLNAYQVDGTAVTPKWSGGSAPTAGNASGIDVYTFTIIKTADATFTVLASQTQFA